jgi:glycosyltransferase involved in cell wall biosynthesis
MSKRRVLFVGEASYLATGFATYWNEVIRRIHARGEFEVAEFGSYASDGDPRNGQVPWRFYPNAPESSNQEAMQVYMSRPANQFGEWRMNDVLMDFKPDIVCGIRDWWMDEFILRSPFRKNFTFVWMPTVDGAPQRDQWIDSYRQCDYVLTYSQYGMELLKQAGGIQTVAVASPGAEIDLFRPVPDKAEHKRRIGLDPNSFIVGTVMRNQKRKLYVDLCEAFAAWLERMKKAGRHDLVRRTYLYLHTSWPDVGYDIGKALRTFKIGNKVLLTYTCGTCGVAYPSFWMGEWTTCRHCKRGNAHPPNANHSLPRPSLAQVMNTFDLYVQYSICEGWGMPVTEAMACGVPALVVNYSAMEDHAKMPGGFPINVQRYFYECVIETEQRRALPDNDHFGELLTRFLKMKPEEYRNLCRRTREYIEAPAEVWGQSEQLPRFSYDRTAAIWTNVLRTCQVHERAETWDHPAPRVTSPDLRLPRPDMTNTEFVRWAVCSVLRRADLADSFMANEWIKALHCGFRIEGNQRIPVDRNGLVQLFLNIVNETNQVETQRVARLGGVNGNQFSIAVA